MEESPLKKGQTQLFAPISAIGRAHLDEADAAGRIAGRDLGKTVLDCPYGRATPMTVKAWEKGFLAARLIHGEAAERPKQERP